MSTLYLDRKGMTLARDGGRLLLTIADERPRSVPIALLDRIVIHARTRLDTGVLSALADAGVAVVVLSPRHGRRVAVVYGRAHNDARARIAQALCAVDPAWRLEWSRRLVVRKLRAQARLLRRLEAARPDRRYGLVHAARRIEALVSAAGTAESAPRLRGLEGAGSAAYFAGFSQVFPPSLDFTGRNRRPPRDPVNACLSLAYTLLHFDAVRALYAHGLDPFVGFYHRPAFGRESLASDFIEPWRPTVDAWILELFRSRTLEARHCVRDKGACLLNKEGRSRFYRAYEEKAPPLRRVLGRSAVALAARLRQDPALSDLAGPDEAEAEESSASGVGLRHDEPKET